MLPVSLLAMSLSSRCFLVSVVANVSCFCPFLILVTNTNICVQFPTEQPDHAIGADNVRRW